MLRGSGWKAIAEGEIQKPAARAVLTATTIKVAVASTKAATTSTRIMGA